MNEPTTSRTFFAVTYDPVRGYVASAPNLRELGGLRRRIEALMVPG